MIDVGDGICVPGFTLYFEKANGTFTRAKANDRGVLNISRLKNVNDTAIMSDAISLNNSTSVKLADINEDRMFITIHNKHNTARVWLKLQAASIDDDKKGIIISPDDGWTMPVDNIYIGEISAIAASDSPDVYVTEY